MGLSNAQVVLFRAKYRAKIVYTKTGVGGPAYIIAESHSLSAQTFCIAK